MLDEDKIKNRKFINAITPYGPKIEIIQKNKVISSQPEIDMSEDDPTIKNMLLCGDGLFNKFTKKRCSVGFFARAKNKTYVVTDEHCRDRTKREPSKFLQLAWNSTSAAAVVGSMLTFVGKPYDFGLIDTSNKSLTLKLLPSVRNTDSKKFRELNIENAILVSTHGAHLCKSGYTTHVTCGLIRAFSAIYMARSRVYFIDFILTNMLSIHGDSGGTTFRYSDLNSVILNGILYGGLGNFATLISPIDKILEYTGVEPITTNSTNSAI
ncbi:hypothetical protein F8M41_012139 [Gigaspora margarita]|uniref:Uncharacterized protein n=1 Tax=Gigaspora margarita TaxID=4874 RepID=A0A8H4A042_GIGMA|nr:hypothetical protein F8M41_012139 [Gigaspora margarita]